MSWFDYVKAAAAVYLAFIVVKLVIDVLGLIGDWRGRGR